MRTLKPRAEITKALESPRDFKLPEHLGRHVGENRKKIEAQITKNKAIELIKAIRDPQMLGAVVSLGISLVCTHYGEQKNLSDTQGWNYALSLLDFYVNPSDTPESADSFTRANRIGRDAFFWLTAIFAGYEGVQKFRVNNKYKTSVENGVAPCPYQNHMVGIGMRDPFIFAEDKKGQSFVKRARGKFAQIVPLQSEQGFYDPADLGTPLNDKGFYANLAALNDGTPHSEMMEHILVSGSYKADALVINAQREHELFEAVAIDSHKHNEDRPDLSAAGSFVKNTIALRKAVTNLHEDPNTVLIIPMHMRQKAFDHSSVKGLQPWARSALANFGQQDSLMPTVKGIIVPEVIFMQQVKQEFEARNLKNKKIYIDTEGQDDQQGKAERCAKYLADILQIEPEQVITNPQNAKDADVCIMLRDSNRHIDPSSQVNQHRLGHAFTFYPATTRHDVVQHTNDAEKQTRIPILYKQAIADEILSLAQNKASDFSVAALQSKELIPA